MKHFICQQHGCKIPMFKKQYVAKTQTSLMVIIIDWSIGSVETSEHGDSQVLNIDDYFQCKFTNNTYKL